MDFKKLEQNLKKHGYQVSHFSTKEEACEYLNTSIDGKIVGMGGSTSFKEMGLYDTLSTHNTVYAHTFYNGPKSKDEIMLSACNADIYLSSANGVSESGEILNIDGRGNRLAGTLMKKEKVYIVFGSNKVAPDLSSALERARNIAAPKNASRLEQKTPCVAQGRCFDCASPERICSALLIFWQKPFWAKEMEAVIIDEELGY